MPVFNDSENMKPFLPEGDYTFRVIGFEIGISNGAQTRGSESYEVKMEVEGHGNTVYETLIDHPKTTWKLDVFLKCCGIKLNKGESFEFRRDKAEQAGVRWVNPIGHRGHFRVFVDEYKDRKKNKVMTFYTDRGALDPILPPEEDDDTPF
jgi:hypothetical protein